jgi:WS/DGAT/MGAT family acyltransferase
MSLERVGANDLTILATDHGQVPMNFGAVLEFGAGDGQQMLRLLADRLAGVRRFRQRLVDFGPLTGPPVWVDDPTFDPADHISASDLHGADVLLDRAADVVCARLPQERPLWAMHAFEGLPGGGFAVVIVMHHVVADGMGGLAVLATLVDGAPRADRITSPQPTRREVFLDARRRVAVRSVGTTVRTVVRGLREMGIGRPSRVPPTSILRPTTGRRHARALGVPLDDVVVAAHRLGVTVNDVIVAAVGGALFDLLRARGESPSHVVVSVPVSARSAGADLGNQVGAIPVAVPAGPSPDSRLRAVAAQTRRAKSQQRGSSAAVLALVFRSLAALRLEQYFINRQRLVHTFETNLRGPAEQLRIAGTPLIRILPIAVNPGNVGVSFDVLSYAGELTICVVADPIVVPEVQRVAELLGSHLAGLTA